MLRSSIQHRIFLYYWTGFCVLLHRKFLFVVSQNTTMQDNIFDKKTASILQYKSKIGDKQARDKQIYTLYSKTRKGFLIFKFEYLSKTKIKITKYNKLGQKKVFKGSVSQDLRWVLLYINGKLSLRPIIASQKFLIY